MRTVEADPGASRGSCMRGFHRLLGSPRDLCSGGSPSFIPAPSVPQNSQHTGRLLPASPVHAEAR